MKQIIIALIIFLSVFVANAQSTTGQIAIYTIVFEDVLTNDAAGQLNNKLQRIVADNGFGSVSYADRFVLSAKVDVLSNSIAQTNPPRVSKKISVSLFIGDIVENRSFASCEIVLAGIGNNDNKALIAALSRLSSSNSTISKMMNDAREKIVEFYGSNSGRFIANAKSIALKGDVDQAIAYLMSIPPVNDECFSLCQNYAVELYNEKNNRDNYSLYSSAKAAWTAKKTKDGAAVACCYLKQVDPSSSCFEEAMALWTEIEDKLDKDDAEAKEMAMRKYEENQIIRQQQIENNQTFRMAIVDACKAIGVAYGEHRPQNVQKIIRSWY